MARLLKQLKTHGASVYCIFSKKAKFQGNRVYLSALLHKIKVKTEAVLFTFKTLPACVVNFNGGQ